MVLAGHLKWLLSFREPEGQVARWIQQLQEYHFKVEHRPGKQHGNADALSRCPCLEDGCKHCRRLDKGAQGDACRAVRGLGQADLFQKDPAELRQA